MTLRAILLGLLLGLCIATLTYFNDSVIRQTQLIGNHLPASVFGTVLVLLLVVNPALRALGLGLQRIGGGEGWGDRLMLKPTEIAVVLAMGLAVCGWPGSNLLRYFTQLMATPAHRLAVQPAWQAAGVLSYVPGQSPEITPGYVADPEAMAAALREPGENPVLQTIADRLPDQAKEALAQGPAGADALEAVIAGLNAVLDTPAIMPREEPLSAHGLRVHNRRVLDAALPGLRPLATGSGVLLEAQGRDDDAVTPLMVGGGPEGVGVLDVPWDVWWPTLRLWGGGLLCAALATLCLVLVMHPQWAHRELLRYPTVEFVHEATRWSPGRFLPEIAGSKLFWIGLVPVAAIHLLNGLHEYFEAMPFIIREMPFGPLRELFPAASRVPGSNRLFQPWIFPSVIGFGFFVTTRVSMSVGLSLVFWVALGAWHVNFGTPLDNTKIKIGSNGTSLRFGAYVAMTLMILYYGRMYYLDVVRGALGLKRATTTPGYAVWAARLAALLTALSVYFLVAHASMSPVIAVMFVAAFLMMLVVLARINAETGLFYAQPDWLPGIALAGIFGVYGLGAEGLVVLLIASQVFAADPREGFSPYLATGLRLGDRIRGADGAPAASPGRLAPVLGAMVAVGLVAAVVATLWTQYNRGLNPTDGFARNLPILTLDQASSAIAQLDARGELSTFGRLTGLEHFGQMQPDGTFVRYASVGFVLLMACAIARTRLPWWPIHPVLFLVWGTYPANYMAFSFLLAAALKWSVSRLGGAKAVNQAKPLMVGLIAGDMLMIIVWSLVGTTYYFATGLTPPTYRILPI